MCFNQRLIYFIAAGMPTLSSSKDMHGAISPARLFNDDKNEIMYDLRSGARSIPSTSFVLKAVELRECFECRETEPF